MLLRICVTERNYNIALQLLLEYYNFNTAILFYIITLYDIKMFNIKNNFCKFVYYV